MCNTQAARHEYAPSPFRITSNPIAVKPCRLKGHSTQSQKPQFRPARHTRPQTEQTLKIKNPGSAYRGRPFASTLSPDQPGIHKTLGKRHRLTESDKLNRRYFRNLRVTLVIINFVLPKRVFKTEFVCDPNFFRNVV